MPLTNWREQVYNVIGSVLYNNPNRTVHFMIPQPDGTLRDRTELPAPVRRLAETQAEGDRNCLQTIQFVHHALIPPGGRHVHELHVHPDAEELIVIMSGEGELHLEGKSRHVVPGDVAYVPPGATHELQNASEGLLGALFINVPVGAALAALQAAPSEA
ncbi:MAG: cupin domain-containing protein [SAR202 cluster bacterium]|nr:cupin domain-containing protein [SAR202 cluster bacterium]